MDILAEQLDTKLRHWRPDIAKKVRQYVKELIDLADQEAIEAIDVMRSSVSNKKYWICSMNPKPGEVWLADLGLAAKTRPVVIVSRDDPNPPRALVIYVPLTTQNRNSQYEVVLPKVRF